MKKNLLTIVISTYIYHKATEIRQLNAIDWGPHPVVDLELFFRGLIICFSRRRVEDMIDSQTFYGDIMREIPSGKHTKNY